MSIAGISLPFSDIVSNVPPDVTGGIADDKT